MKFKEINVPEGIVQQINQERPFAGIAVDLENADIVNSNVNLDVSYEDTLEDIEKTMGYMPNTYEMLEKNAERSTGIGW